jgi:hypothetical protein
MLKKFTLSLVTAGLLAAGSTGAAQDDADVNPALQALVSFAQLLQPEVLAELRLLYPTNEALAAALLQVLQERGVIDVQTAAAMQQAVEARVMPRDTLIVFLADVANGTEPIARNEDGSANTFALETDLALLVPTLDIPRGDDSGNLASEDVANVVTEVAVGDGGILDAIADAYEDAITPRNAEEAGG